MQGIAGKAMVSPTIAVAYGEFFGELRCRAGNLQGKHCPKLGPGPSSRNTRPKAAIRPRQVDLFHSAPQQIDRSLLCAGPKECAHGIEACENPF